MGIMRKRLELTFKQTLLFNYLMYEPESAPPSQGYPLILSLHGAGQRGDNLELLENHGLLKYINSLDNFPFLVCTPQCPESDTWLLYLDELLILIDEISQTYPVDPTRVIVMGLSMGANGTWLLACKAPGRFAAAVTVCGWGDWLMDFPDRVSQMKSVPVWAFHGEDDDVIVVDESIKMVHALKQAGGDAQLTIYPGVKHESWDRAFAEDDLYVWLNSKRKSV